MTTYYISCGYNGNHRSVDVTSKIVAEVNRLKADPSIIAAEVLRLEPDIDKDILEECVLAYSDDHSGIIRLVDNSIVQTASGGEPYRSVKESVRRAVCRLVTEACHRERMNVSVEVV